MMALNFIRCDNATIVLILVLLIFENVFYLEKSVLSSVNFHSKFPYLYDFQACKYQLKYSILFQFIHAIWFVWRDVWCWKCGMLWKWHIAHVGSWGCEIFRLWDVQDVGCFGCGMFGMWDVGCGTFAGMSDVDLQNATQRQLEFQRWKWN